MQEYDVRFEFPIDKVGLGINAIRKYETRTHLACYCGSTLYPRL